VDRFPSTSEEPVVAELQLARGGELPTVVHDCWNTIGVGGNASCRELLRYVHCRNCPVYSAAAVHLLDRPLSDDYRREWTNHYAQEKKLIPQSGTKTSVVIFRIVSEWLALPTQAFQEVAVCRALHTLPHRRRGVVLGLVNVRGELVVCASLGRLLGLSGREGKVETLKAESRAPELRAKPENQFQLSQFQLRDRLLVANWDGGRIAFPVQEVHGIHRVHGDTVREPPATIAKSIHSYSSGVFVWRDYTVGFLNADRLFAELNCNLT
jgi:chemotaxis-related protein WspD